MGASACTQMPAQVSLPVGQTFLFESLVHRLEEAGRADVQRRERGHADLGEIDLPVELGGELLQFRAGHLVVESFGVAPFDPRHGTLGQRGFDAHHGLRFGGSGLGLVAEELEHFLHVRQVGFAQFDRLGVVLSVVVAVGQAESALIGVGDDLIGVVGVLDGFKTEQDIVSRSWPRRRRRFRPWN